ncbi:SGNH/GDSL hydrolase family protein [bacterium]|nr:SGNH/GDSL hydrolase family protein [bacterium]
MKLKLRYLLLLPLLPLGISGVGAGPSRLIQNLEAGKPQRLIVYGTSLTAGGPWVQQTRAVLDYRYPGQLEFVNSGQGGQNSIWGLGNLEQRVLALRPDTLTIEFGMNDAAANSGLTTQTARQNIETMIDLVHEAVPDCEIILMTMNPVGGEIEARPSDHPWSRASLPQIYETYRQLAKDRGLRLIDHNRNWLEYRRLHPEKFDKHVPDGVHPDQTAACDVITPGMIQGLGVPPVLLSED